MDNQTDMEMKNLFRPKTFLRIAGFLPLCGKF